MASSADGDASAPVRTRWWSRRLLGVAGVAVAVVAVAAAVGIAARDQAGDPPPPSASSVATVGPGSSAPPDPPSSTGSEPVAAPTTAPPSSPSSGAPTSLLDPADLPEVCRSDVWANLEACGWPGPDNTGPAESVALTSRGPMTISEAGTVLTACSIEGGLVIDAVDVVVRDCVITNTGTGAGGSYVVYVAPGATAVLERVVIDGTDSIHIGIFYDGAELTVRAAEITGVNDGLFFAQPARGYEPGNGDNFVVADSWIHDLTTDAANGHIDGMQTSGASNGWIVHNTIDIAPAYREGQRSDNAAVALWNFEGDTEDIVVEGNLMLGGGFTIYAHDVSPDHDVVRITHRDNRFSIRDSECVGIWGVWYPRGAPTDTWVREGNIVLETGQNIDEVVWDGDCPAPGTAASS